MVTPDEKYLQPDPVGVVCRHCGEPIEEKIGKARSIWIHLTGYFSCHQGRSLTLAEPVPVVPEGFKRNAESLNSEVTDSSSVVPENDDQEICKYCGAGIFGSRILGWAHKQAANCDFPEPVVPETPRQEALRDLQRANQSSVGQMLPAGGVERLAETPEPEGRETTWARLRDANPHLNIPYGQTLFEAGWDAAVKATAAKCAQLAARSVHGLDHSKKYTPSEIKQMVYDAVYGMDALAIPAEYGNGDN